MEKKQWVRSLFLPLLLATLIGLGFCTIAQPVLATDIPKSGQLDLPSHGPIEFSPPTLVDLNGDGKLEILVGTSDGKVVAISHISTAPYLELKWSYDTSQVVGGPSAIRGAVSVADLDNDGTLEAVVPVGEIADKQKAGGLVVLNAENGHYLWDHKTLDHSGPTLPGQGTPPDGLNDAVVGAPALGDLDGDGDLEIVFGSFDFRIYVLHHDGTMAKGWPVLIRDSVWSSPALADLDNDGDLEIIIGVDTHYEPDFGTPDGGGLYVFNFDGTVVWRQFVGQVIFSSPAVGDLDGDGSLEIVHGTGNYYNNPEAGYKVYVWRANGSPYWSANTDGYTFASPALGDIDGDGRLEVVINTQDRANNGKTYAWKYNGTPLWSALPTDWGGQTANLNGSPVIADYGLISAGAESTDPDGVPDVFTNVRWNSAILDGKTGAQFTASSFPHAKPTFTSGYTASDNGPALGDLDGDGKLELVLASANSSNTAAQVVYWNLESVDSTMTAPWPMFSQNPRHTGLYPTAPAFDSLVVAHMIPDVVLPGSKRQVQIILKNVGTADWKSGEVYLGAVGGSDAFTSNMQVALSKTIAPGQTHTFEFDFQAPNAEGYYTTDWRLMRSGTAFGRKVEVNVKVGNQPALQVLTSQGIKAGGLASAPLPDPTDGYNGWHASGIFKLANWGRGYHLLDQEGGYHYGGNTFKLPSPPSKQPPQDFVLGSGAIPMWILLGDGRIIGCNEDPRCNLAFTPPTPTGIAARSLALPPDGKGIYVVDGNGNVYNGGTAPRLAPPSGLPTREDIIVRIKLTQDGQGFYLLDKYGRVWAGGNAPALNWSYDLHMGENWAVDFELTEDEKGFYMLDTYGGIHAGGDAPALAINVPPASSNAGYGRDLEIVDSRRTNMPSLAVSPSSGSQMIEPGSDTTIRFPMTLSNPGASSLNWTATANWTSSGADLPGVTVSPRSGRLDAAGAQEIEVVVGDVSGLATGTYTLEVKIVGDGNGTQLSQTATFSVIVVDDVHTVALPNVQGK